LQVIFALGFRASAGWESPDALPSKAIGTLVAIQEKHSARLPNWSGLLQHFVRNDSLTILLEDQQWLVL
jgi:hypothetical protein